MFTLAIFVRIEGKLRVKWLAECLVAVFAIM